MFFFQILNGLLIGQSWSIIMMISPILTSFNVFNRFIKKRPEQKDEKKGLCDILSAQVKELTSNAFWQVQLCLATGIFACCYFPIAIIFFSILSDPAGRPLWVREF